jgi:patatin-like phospholipase/acyl hydrolase
MGETKVVAVYIVDGLALYVSAKNPTLRKCWQNLYNMALIDDVALDSLVKPG